VKRIVVDCAGVARQTREVIVDGKPHKKNGLKELADLGSAMKIVVY
jgi:hypothetical protein